MEDRYQTSDRPLKSLERLSDKISKGTLDNSNRESKALNLNHHKEVVEITLLVVEKSSAKNDIFS